MAVESVMYLCMYVDRNWCYDGEEVGKLRPKRCGTLRACQSPVSIAYLPGCNISIRACSLYLGQSGRPTDPPKHSVHHTWWLTVCKKAEAALLLYAKKIKMCISLYVLFIHRALRFLDRTFGTSGNLCVRVVTWIIEIIDQRTS
jgi:hypothetical protein